MGKEDVRRLDLNLILVFDALLKYRQVTRAAASLNITQSAISHSLKRLRTFFDDPLFARSATGMTPTAQALELSTTVVQIASLIRDGLLTQAAFKPETANRTLTLCMTDLAEATLLPTLIPALRQASPGCALHAVQTQPSETRAMLESGEADLAIGSVVLLPSPGEIIAQKLYTQANVVIAHREVAGPQGLDLDAYCQRPHISVAPVRGRMSILDDALARLGRQRRIVLTTEHHLIIPRLIKSDPTLISTAPRTMADLFAEGPELVFLDLPVELPRFDVFQYWHSRFQKDRFHIWFRNLIAHFFQHDSAIMSSAHDSHESLRSGSGEENGL